MQLPWDVMPPCPGLPPLEESQVHGYLTLSTGVKVWHAIFGIPLKDSLAQGKPPVVIPTGGTCHSGYWGHQIRHFSPKYTLIVFDIRGHGKTPLGDDTELTYNKLEDDIIAILDYYSIQKVSLIGWSDGAMMCWTALLRHSHRVDRFFSFGAVDDCTKNDGDAIDEYDSVKAFFSRFETEWLELNPGGDVKANFAPYWVLWKKEPRWTAEMFKHVPVRGEIPDAPIVWVAAGDHDSWMPDEVNRRLRAFIPNSSYVEIPGASHTAFWQAPRVFNALLECFLEDGTY
jgi:pimeloyl-ACP methyl ester carboxylesterase